MSTPSYMMGGSTILWPALETSRCAKTRILVTIFSHAVDLAFGLFLTITGFSILDVKVISYNSISLGAIMTIASLSGVFGFMSTGCRRCGLKVDIILTPIIALYISILVILSMAMTGRLKSYMTRNKTQLEITQQYIDAFDKNVILYWVVMILLVITEIIRFFTIRKISYFLSEDDNRRISDQDSGLHSALIGEDGKDALQYTTSIDSDEDTIGLFTLHKQKGGGGNVEADEFSPIDSQLHVTSLHWSRGLHGTSSGDRASISSGETSISALYDIRWGNQGTASSNRENNTVIPEPIVDFL